MTRKDPMNALHEAVHQRNHHDRAAAEARKRIDELLLELLREDPTRDREELAKLADVSPVKVRAIAKAAGIPPLKPGGRGRRITKSDV